MLLQRLQGMQSALVTLKENSYRQQGDDMKQRMAKMKPLRLPKRSLAAAAAAATPSGDEKQDLSKEAESVAAAAAGANSSAEVIELMKRANHLKTALDNALLSSSSVPVDLKKRTCSEEAAAALLTRRTKQRLLEEEAARLQLEVARLKAARVPGGQVQADICTFPSPQFGKALNENDYNLVCKLRLPVGPKGDAVAGSRVPLVVGLEELQRIHQTVMG